MQHHAERGLRGGEGCGHAEMQPRLQKEFVKGSGKLHHDPHHRVSMRLITRREAELGLLSRSGFSYLLFSYLLLPLPKKNKLLNS